MEKDVFRDKKVHFATLHLLDEKVERYNCSDI